MDPLFNKSSLRVPLVALVFMAAFALAPACGDGGTISTTGAETTADETTGTTAPATAATTEDPTTGPPTGTGTGTDTSTTGDPGVCDGSMASNAFECAACTECGSWTIPLAGSSYPPALVCVLEGMRDDAVVGAESQSCEQGKCSVNRMLGTGMGTMISQYMVLDQNDQSMKYLGIQELQLKDAAYFEACLAAYDETCVSPNSWFLQESVNVENVVCP